MKRLVLIVALVMGWALVSIAQAPYWVKRLPVPKSGNFYYRVTIAEGRNYKDAYAEAFAMAVYESYSKLSGIAVTIGSDQQAIKEGVVEAISTANEGQMRLPINKVCEYEERVVTSNKIRLYVLWQVANSALADPQFENFNKCD
jgi:hypothetical protein